MTKPSSWDKVYGNKKPYWGTKPDHILEKYADLVPKGPVLDLGAGEGRNALFFARKGYQVEAVDISYKALEKCRKWAKQLKLTVKTEAHDLVTYDIIPGKYTLIICAWVLNFFKKGAADEIIKQVKRGLKQGGFAYIVVFSTSEPHFKERKQELEMVEKNTFYLRRIRSYVHYFTRSEVLSYFRDYKTIYCVEGIELDTSHAQPHHHGIVEYVGQKQYTS